MATYTDMINSVLIRLREPTVALPGDNDYSLLIGEFVNESKREVEDAWKWSSLRETLSITTAQGSNGYIFTGPATKDMSRYKLQHPQCSVYDTTNQNPVKRRHSIWLKRQLIQNAQEGFPCFYYIEGVNASGDPIMYFYQIPSGIFNINIEVVIPQVDFTAGGEIILVPQYPVMLSAYAKAIAERGEDNGKTHGEALMKARQALNDSIEIDESKTDNDDWDPGYTAPSGNW